MYGGVFVVLAVGYVGAAWIQIEYFPDLIEPVDRILVHAIAALVLAGVRLFTGIKSDGTVTRTTAVISLGFLAASLYALFQYVRLTAE